ncbi:MAG TPA: neutral zinc metallopeptidase [Hyphomicrobiales bacterium]|nr:neutral zinc metallopeptidase [Hyphomicrobiales bacterium]
MLWKGRRQSSNIEDRRGEGGGFGPGGFRLPGGGGLGSGRGPVVRKAGGSGIGFLIVAGIVLWLLGINPLTMLTGEGPSVVPTETARNEAPAGRSGTNVADDDMKAFVATVLAETEDTWHKIFQEAGRRYTEPTLVLFAGSVRSACGFASAATGPFYCPGDNKLYLDLDFYDELARRFKAGGDFAQAYVLAHEVGHHVQNLVGVLPKFNEMRQRMNTADANQMSIRVELQADCFAGIWANHTAQKKLLESGDIDEALNAASQIGDDTIQRRTQGYVVPDAFNHGTSAQRVRWFKKGLQTGDLRACDTFNTDDL